MTSFKQLFPYWFISALCLLLLHQLFEYVGLLQIELLDSYLDPFLASPIVLHLYFLDLKILRGNKKASLPLAHIVMLTVLLCVVSEIIFPTFSSKFHQDGFDLLAIIAGSLCYYFFLTKAYK